MKISAVISALFLGVLAASGGEDSPGAAAMSFLKSVQGTSHSIAEILAESSLSPHCGDRRRKWIEKRLLQLRGSFREEGMDLEVLDVKQDGDLAGVLVAVVPSADPFSSRVLPVAVRILGEGWVAAPVMGSFANANVGFDDEVRARVDGLERWMGRQRVLRMRDLYLEAEGELDRRMEAAVPEELLVEGSAEKVMEGFLEACRKKDLAAVLVFLGAASGPGDEANSPQAIVSRGLRGKDSMGQWMLLTSPDVAGVVAGSREERSQTVVTVLFYDSDSGNGAKLLNFSLSRGNGRWQVDLPKVLREAYRERRPWLGPDATESKLRRRYAEFFEASHPAQRFDDSKAMGERVAEVLRSGTLAEFFALLSRNEGFAEGERLVTYAEAAQLWDEFRKRGRDATHGSLVEVMEEGTAAVVVLHLVTTAEFGRLELVTLLLVREESGWAIAPGVTVFGNWETMPRQESLDQKEVLMKFVRRKAELENMAAESFLKGFAEVDSAIDGKVTAEEAGRLVREFREHVRAGDLLRAFSCSALLDLSDGAWEGLNSLTYEYRGSRNAEKPDRELHLQTKGAWAGVSLRLDSGPGGVPDYLLYLVRSTAEGPRIVVDAGLRLATNKGREILNGRSLAHLEEHLAPDELGLVRALFDVHLEKSKIDYAEWEKSTKSSR